MKNYQKVSQGADGQLLAWYGVVDHSGNVEIDFDVLEDYAVYPYEGIASGLGTFIAEYLPSDYCFGAYNSVEEACEAVLVKIKEKQEATKKIEEAGAKFQEVVKANSLDERYKDVTVEKKEKTAEQVKNKYATYERKAKLFADARMKKTAELNRAYYDRLLDH